MFTGHLQDARESLSSRGSYRQTRLDCLQQPVAICEGCAVSRAAHTVPSGSAAAHRSRWSSDRSAPAAQSTEQPLGLTPCTGVCPGSLSPCWEACPSDSSVSPLEPPYLTVHPFARSHVEGEIPPRSQTAASTDAPAGCRALGIHPHSSPESSARTAPARAPTRQEGTALLLAWRCPHEGDCPPREAPLAWAQQGASCWCLLAALTVTHRVGVSSGGVSLWEWAPLGKHINWEANLIKH